MKNAIEKFYEAFNNIDAESMLSLYHNDIVFKDPAFGELKGVHAKNMWRMLCASQNKETFKVDVSNIKMDGNTGSAHWEAHYIFSKTGRKVHNKIEAQFEFKEGLIIKHTDTFNVQKWAAQAMGFKGWILGGTSFFQRQLNTQTQKLLNRYEHKNVAK